MNRADRRRPAYLLYRAGSALAAALPTRLTFPVAAGLGHALGRLARGKREVVRRNLRRVVGTAQLEEVIDASFRTYARYWVEALRLPAPGLEEIGRRTTSEGLEPVTAHVAGGGGVVFVTPHVGNWDIAGAWLASYGWPVMAVAEQLEPPALFEHFRRLRAAVGIEVVPLGDASIARTLVGALRDGKVLGLVADRDIAGTGIEVKFFGEKTLLPAGPAVLALRTGAMLVPGAVYQRPRGRFHAVILDPIELPADRSTGTPVQEVTQLIAENLEVLIRREPSQWHLFQPNWPTDPGYQAGVEGG